VGRNNTNAKYERYKGIMRLPRLDKSGLAMTERKIDSRFRGNDRSGAGE